MLANTVKKEGARNGVYDKLRRGWAEKFHSVENNEEIGSALMAHTDEHRDRNEASASCSDLQLGWALQKPRSQAVRFTDEIKQYLTTRFELGERAGNEADPGKVAADSENIEEPRWFADVWKKRLTNEESSARLRFETSGYA